MQRGQLQRVAVGMEIGGREPDLGSGGDRTARRPDVAHPLGVRPFSDHHDRDVECHRRRAAAPSMLRTASGATARMPSQIEVPALDRAVARRALPGDGEAAALVSAVVGVLARDQDPRRPRSGSTPSSCLSSTSDFRTASRATPRCSGDPNPDVSRPGPLRRPRPVEQAVGELHGEDAAHRVVDPFHRDGAALRRAASGRR